MIWGRVLPRDGLLEKYHSMKTAKNQENCMLFSGKTSAEHTLFMPMGLNWSDVLCLIDRHAAGGNCCAEGNLHTSHADRRFKKISDRTFCTGDTPVLKSGLCDGRTSD